MAEAPLSGIRVLELANMIAVPQATQLLASYGAEVTKVEDTQTGDLLRFYGTSKNGLGGWFLNANAGKRSIAINLKSDEGKGVLLQLVADADVLIDGYRSGTMDRLGLGYDTLSKTNPSLIYCASSGFGPDGPYADQPVYDPLIQALAGWAGAQKVDGNPSLIRAMAADKIGAYNNAQAIMAALVQRGRTGTGCHIETNMLDANIAYVWPDVMMHCTLTDNEDVNHLPNLLDSYRLYTSQDGWVSIAIGTDAQWASACEALERPDIFADERLVTTAGRATNIVEWYDRIDEMASAYSTTEVVRRLLEADVPAAPVLDPTQVFDNEHVRTTQTVQESDHPIAGRYRHPRSRAAQFGTDLNLSPAPVWGEHSSTILEELGFSAEEAEGLIQQGAVKQA